MTQTADFFDLSPAPKAAPARAQTRNGGIEALRFLGAFGIVLFHVKGPGAALGYAALPIFIFLSVHFCLRLSEGQSLQNLMRRRVSRLLMPWVFWCAVFAALKSQDALMSGGSIADEFAPWMIGTGPSIHLWFLPFIAAASMIAIALNTVLRPASPAFGSLVLAGLSLGCLALGSLDLPAPFAQWVFGMPAVFLALAFYRIDHPTNLFSLALWSVMIAVAVGLGWTDGSLQLALTFAVVALVLSVNLPTSPTLRYFAGLSLGVYIIHPIIISVGLRLADPALLEHSLSGAFAAFVLSALATAVLQQTPLVRRFI
jgi:peptidoglycan/LPS O-acetylase OafA/YrhL